MNWLRQKFELSRTGAAGNVRPMEGLRGFAVFLVFLVHYVTLVTPWTESQIALMKFATALHTMGNTGVDLFFVLSGYLIYGSLIAKPQAFGRFMARRVKRIYPTFIVVFATYVGLSFLFPMENKIPLSIFLGLIYLLQNLLLLPGIFPIQPLITVAWSLSYEMFYYLVIPGVIAIWGLRERSVGWRVGFFVAVTVIGAVVGAVYGGPIRLIMFVSGILLFEALAMQRIPSPSGALGLTALVAGLLAILLPLPGASGYMFKIMVLFGAFFVLCLACFRNASGWLAKAFSWTPLRWLGNMSYSYYLLHALALKAGFMVFGKLVPASGSEQWVFWLMMPAMFALTLVASAVLFLAVERPFSLAPKQAH